MVELHPSWSPDDFALVFYNAGRKGGIYVMNDDGTGLRKLARGAAPAWRR